uniref:DNA2/NAM7 helicase helicase domain-containing protein n=1 Tax=Caenorhabditis japonica TaxID=281687 RepID=A0A8R1IU98_CAEJA
MEEAGDAAEKIEVIDVDDTDADTGMRAPGEEEAQEDVEMTGAAEEESDLQDMAKELDEISDEVPAGVTDQESDAQQAEEPAPSSPAARAPARQQFPVEEEEHPFAAYYGAESSEEWPRHPAAQAVEAITLAHIQKARNATIAAITAPHNVRERPRREGTEVPSKFVTMPDYDADMIFAVVVHNLGASMVVTPVKREDHGRRLGVDSRHLPTSDVLARGLATLSGAHTLPPLPPQDLDPNANRKVQDLTLSDQQMLIINTLSSNNFTALAIDCGPGTGKTTTLILAVLSRMRQITSVSVMASMSNSAVTAAVARLIKLDEEKECRAVRLITAKNWLTIEYEHKTPIDFPVRWIEFFLELVTSADNSQQVITQDIISAAIYLIRAQQVDSAFTRTQDHNGQPPPPHHLRLSPLLALSGPSNRCAASPPPPSRSDSLVPPFLTNHAERRFLYSGARGTFWKDRTRPSTEERIKGDRSEDSSRATDVNSRIIQLENELKTTETTAEWKKMVLQDFLIVRSVQPTSYKRQIEETGGRESSPDDTRSTPKVPFLKRSCQYDLYPSGPSLLNFYSSEKIAARFYRVGCGSQDGTLESSIQLRLLTSLLGGFGSVRIQEKTIDTVVGTIQMTGNLSIRPSRSFKTRIQAFFWHPIAKYSVTSYTNE